MSVKTKLAVVQSRLYLLNINTSTLQHLLYDTSMPPCLQSKCDRYSWFYVVIARSYFLNNQIISARLDNVTEYIWCAHASTDVSVPVKCILHLPLSNHVHISWTLRSLLLLHFSSPPWMIPSWFHGSIYHLYSNNSKSVYKRQWNLCHKCKIYLLTYLTSFIQNLWLYDFGRIADHRNIELS